MNHLTSSGVLLAIAMVGCGGGGSTPAEDGGPGGDEAMGNADGDPANPDGGDDGGSSLSHCPTAPDVQGPPMARVRWANGIAFCIDSTEVTNADYAAFLAALAAGTAIPAEGARCLWNNSLAPEPKSTNGPPCPAFDPIGRAAYPVVCVDWCDADRYCRWAGKHLCQKPGGGVVQSIASKDASEWVIACTGDGTKKYPHGDTAAAGTCVDRQFPAPTPALRPVKDAVMCEGGVPGLFDMSGNAWEWHDDCEEMMGDTNGGDDTCGPIGGSFSTELMSATCTEVAPFLRKQVAGDTGFRCCADADFF